MSGWSESTAPEFADLRRLYGRSRSERIDELIAATDALAAGLQTLRTTPTPDGADCIANQLHGMQRSAGQLVTCLAREVAE